MKRANAEATQIKGPQREENGDDEVSGCRGYSYQELAQG